MASFGAGLACGIGCGMASGILLGKHTGSSEILARIKDAIQKGELVVQNAKGDKMSGKELTELLSQKRK